MNGGCNGRCTQEGFPIQRLENKKVYEYVHGKNGKSYQSNYNNMYTSALVYNSEHRRIGLAKCTACNYITALPSDDGTRCPCCKLCLSKAASSKAHYKKMLKRID